MTRFVQTMIGAPGCGKTTACLDFIENEINNGINPEEIAFMSFSRKAANEAADRARVRFSLDDNSFPHFRTLHSAAYRSLGLKRGEIMDKPQWDDFGSRMGYKFKYTYSADTERAREGGEAGDVMLRIIAYAKARNISLEDAYYQSDEYTLRLADLKYFAACLQEYKRVKGLYDFADILDLCKDPLPVKVFVLDEAQDCSPSQWALARRLARNAEKVIIAGDDKQSIYDWAGADPKPMFRFRGENRVLPKSYRLPRRIKSLVDKIGGRIQSALERTFEAREEEGILDWIANPEQADLNNGQTWLLLARNRWQLPELERIAKLRGVVYRDGRGEWSNEKNSVRAVMAYERLRRGERVTLSEARRIAPYVGLSDLLVRGGGGEPGQLVGWQEIFWPFEGRPDWMNALRMRDDEVEYIRDLRRNGEPLKGEGRVIISTVHAAKGGEADNVVLMTDISARSRRAMDKNPDPENRVLYVGASRSRHALYLCQPQTPYHWTI